MCWSIHITHTLNNIISNIVYNCEICAVFYEREPAAFNLIIYFQAIEW